MSATRAWTQAAMLASALLLSCGPLRAAEVVAEGLMPGMAVLRVDGERVTLRPGQGHGGVELIDVSAEEAVIAIDGERRRLGISQRVESTFTQPETRSISIRRNANLQYLTSAEINGRRVQVLIDTGANNVAMNATQARALGIREGEGVTAQVQTASDVRLARQVELRSVTVGGIEAQQITATVLDGEQPAVILLGMSYLQHVELEERDGILTLRGRW